jgi:hypothetical protein
VPILQAALLSRELRRKGRPLDSGTSLPIRQLINHIADEAFERLILNKRLIFQEGLHNVI